MVVTSPVVGSARAVSEPDETPGAFDVSGAYGAHGRVLLGFAINAVGDRGLAEDCVQETFLRAWRARDRFEPLRAGERTWLFAIARNVIADALASRERRARLAADPLDNPLDDAPAPGTDPLERLRLLEGLAKLSPEHRDVVLAIHVEGLSYAEVSEQTGTPVPTLRTRAFYGLKALRAHLDGAEDSDVAT